MTDRGATDRLEPLDAVHARMRAALDRKGPAEPLYAWIRYHLGWADAQGNAEAARRAKGFRPTLCLLACRAVGGDPDSAVAAAAAIELTHEFSLVHDDIEDGDRTRRGRPAVWTVVGQAQAVNLGDAIFSLARVELNASPVDPATLARVNARYDRACIALAEGQHLDLAFETRSEIGIEDYIGMIRRKTGSLLGAAAGIGAELGGASPAAADTLERFGSDMGIAFQIADDVLGLWGDEAITGKPAGNDLLRGKKSLPVLFGLEPHASDASLAQDLATFLAGREDARPDQARALADRLEAIGARSRAEGEARALAAAALDALDDLDLRPGPRGELADLAGRFAKRVR